MASSCDGVLTNHGASGMSPEGRVAEPHITYADRSVTITMGVVGRPGGQTCPGNPEWPVTIELAEPLGDRALLDGSTLPPRDATTCVPTTFCR